jgi:hypothetical protein
MLFDAAAILDSPYPRTNAYAVLGAVEVLASRPRHPTARALLTTAAGRLGNSSADSNWPWPEARLTYDNARLAEARIAAGAALADQALLNEGLRLLAWLVNSETNGDHFSFTPVGGRGHGDPKPAFDQQPIEAASMADACSRAFEATGDDGWARTALRATAWFVGANDVGISLLDESTGGCKDGLTSDGCNLNQGAESTIAMIAALQQAHHLQTILDG